MISFNTFERSPQLAELKVSYKRKRARLPQTSESLRDPQGVAAYLRSVWNQDTLELSEGFLLLCLNASHEPLGWVRLFSGGFNSARVDLRLVFSVALQAASSAIIVAHNHPSGNPEPSAEDRRATAELKRAGEMLGLKLLDHIILTKTSEFSFCDAGLL
jgi:DNA repair protein RadC